MYVLLDECRNSTGTFNPMNVTRSQEAAIVNYLFPFLPNTPKITRRGDIRGGMSEGGPSSSDDLSVSQIRWYGDIQIVIGILVAAALIGVALAVVC
jgi:hypothetical protein